MHACPTVKLAGYQGPRSPDQIGDGHRLNEDVANVLVDLSDQPLHGSFGRLHRFLGLQFVERDLNSH